MSPNMIIETGLFLHSSMNVVGSEMSLVSILLVLTLILAEVVGVELHKLHDPPWQRCRIVGRWWLVVVGRETI